MNKVVLFLSSGNYNEDRYKIVEIPKKDNEALLFCYIDYQLRCYHVVINDKFQFCLKKHINLKHFSGEAEVFFRGTTAFINYDNGKSFLIYDTFSLESTMPVVKGRFYDSTYNYFASLRSPREEANLIREEDDYFTKDRLYRYKDELETYDGIMCVVKRNFSSTRSYSEICIDSVRNTLIDNSSYCLEYVEDLYVFYDKNGRIKGIFDNEFDVISFMIHNSTSTNNLEKLPIFTETDLNQGTMEYETRCLEDFVLYPSKCCDFGRESSKNVLKYLRKESN